MTLRCIRRPFFISRPQSVADDDRCAAAEYRIKRVQKSDHLVCRTDCRDRIIRIVPKHQRIDRTGHIHQKLFNKQRDKQSLQRQRSLCRSNAGAVCINPFPLQDAFLLFLLCCLFLLCRSFL